MGQRKYVFMGTLCISCFKFVYGAGIRRDYNDQLSTASHVLGEQDASRPIQIYLTKSKGREGSS